MRMGIAARDDGLQSPGLLAVAVESDAFFNLCASRNFFSYPLVLLAQGVRLRWFREQQVGIYQKNSYVNDSAEKLI